MSVETLTPPATVAEQAAVRVMIVDDDPIVADSLSELLQEMGHTCCTAGDGNEALSLLDDAAGAHGQPPVGLVIADVNMPRCDGLELLKRIRKKHPAVALIIITGFGKIEAAVEAIRLGAVDYLTKPVVDDELRIAVGKALQQHALLAENQTLRNQLTERYGLDNIIGGDYRMQRVFDLIEAVAASRTTVLIEGESGTGKSMVARAVHTRSERSAGPFVTFSCGAIPETLLESELFGHTKGAFTGAAADKEGRILAADGGTLFIDEINSATPALQLKLLRVLQERQFEPVGSTRTVNVNVRFILATNQRLLDLVQQGQFREDLYYRINVVNIQLPSLRQRLGDVPVLARHFLERFCRELGRTVAGFTDEAMEALRRHDWPGNVRELENAIERAVVLCRRPVVDVTDLPDPVRTSHEGRPSDSPHPRNHTPMASGDGNALLPALANGWTPMPLEQALAEPERLILAAALRANHWNRQETARQLNINRTTLYKKIKQFGLEGEAP